MKFVTDTHSLVWYLQDSKRLSSAARNYFEPELPRGQIVIPSIVLAELLYIARKTTLPFSVRAIFMQLQQAPQFECYPLTVEVLQEAIPLKHLEMHDALIVATARYLQLPLMTCDSEIIAAKCVQILKP